MKEGQGKHLRRVSSFPCHKGRQDQGMGRKGENQKNRSELLTNVDEGRVGTLLLSCQEGTLWVLCGTWKMTE